MWDHVRREGVEDLGAFPVALAAALTVPAVFLYWGQRTVEDGQRYVETVGPLVESPQVQDAVATTVTDAVRQQVDVEAILADVFADVITDAPRLQALIGPLAGAIDGLIDAQVRRLVSSDAFADFWVAANTRAQATLVRLLEGEQSGAVALQDEQVVLDVSDLVEEVQQRLVDRGLTVVENVPVPQTDREIVLLEAPQLRQLRTIYAFTDPLAPWLLAAVVALYLAAFVLARQRPRMGVLIGAVLVADALLLAFLVSVTEQLFVNQLAGTTFGPASRVFYSQLVSFLERGQGVMLWLGLLLVLAGLFAGRNAVGTAVRGSVRRGLESVGRELADGPAASAGRWVRANAGWLRYAVGACGAVVLVWGGDVTQAHLAWAAVVVVALMATLQVMVGVGARPAGAVSSAPDDPHP